MRTRLLAGWIGWAIVLVSPGHAATLRTDTILHDDFVRLSDLFEGVEYDRTIGPAPEIGGRIFVEAPQLNAIARQFNVDWRSSSPGDRTVLERPGRPFPRDQAMGALRAALQSAGVSTDADVDVPAYVAPMLPPGVTATADIGQLDYDPVSGRFTALLALETPNMQPVNARLSGRVQEMMDIPVAVRRLLPGDVVGPADVKIGRVRADTVRTEVARDTGQAVGMAMRRPVGPGAPFVLADLGRPLAVQRGEAVHIQLELPGLLISAEGMALEAGANGDRIRVMNTSSRAVLDAQVVGAGQVRLTGAPASPSSAGGSLPVLVATR